MTTSNQNQPGQQDSKKDQENPDLVEEEPRKTPTWVELLAQVSTLSWNLVVPIVGGVLLGTYLDKRFGGDVTWTLSLLVLGVMIALSNLYNLYIEHGHKNLSAEKGKEKDNNAKK
ncbi:MAG: AtpZ/AtpI family protein [Anaerolineales bacterium]